MNHKIALKIIAFCLGFIVVFAAISLLVAFPVMWIWNYGVVEAVTFAKPVDFWAAFCLNFFFGLITGAGGLRYKNNSTNKK